MRGASRHSHHRIRAFTVMEMLITVTALGIALAIAIPSFREAGLNAATSAQTNDLITALNTARAEATKFTQPVRVSAVGGNWQDGWTLATDRDRDGLLNGTDIELRTGDVTRDGFILVVEDTAGTAVTDIWFNGTGRLVGSTVPIVMTVRRPDGDTTKSRRVCIALSGRVESFKGETACA